MYLGYFEKFKRRLPGNVLLSYPKSGRTWVRFALNLAGANVTYNHGGYATRDPGQLGYKFKGIKAEFFGTRTVFLYRNPVDTAVSEYHQIHNRIFNSSHPKYDEMVHRLTAENNLPPTNIDDFVLHPIWGCKKICQFNRAHIKFFLADKAAKIISYETLREDPHQGFLEILNFFQVKNFDIDAVVQQSSFSNMRQLELNADPEFKKQHALYGIRSNDENSLKVRKGKVQGYLEVLKPETIAQAQSICAAYNFEI